MATKFRIDDLEILVGKVEEFSLEFDDPELENLLWYGISYMWTTIEGIRVFYMDRTICKKRIAKPYLKSYNIDPIPILELLD